MSLTTATIFQFQRRLRSVLKDVLTQFDLSKALARDAARLLKDELERFWKFVVGGWNWLVSRCEILLEYEIITQITSQNSSAFVKDSSNLSLRRNLMLKSLLALLQKNPTTNRDGIRYELSCTNCNLQVRFKGRLIGIWTYLHDKLVFNPVDKDSFNLETPDVEQAFLTTREIVKSLLSGNQLKINHRNNRNTFGV